jgi:uncharacterized protein YkwD
MPRPRIHVVQTAKQIRAYGFSLFVAIGGLNSIGGAAPGATANAPARRMQPPAIVVSAAPTVASTVIDLTNQARAAAGLAPLTEDARLTAAAAAHSADQATTRVMSHVGTDGSSPGARMTAAGYRWWTWGENVAAGQTTAAIVVDAWMNSPGHRANILNPSFVSIGVGSVASVDGILFWTMDLAA